MSYTPHQQALLEMGQRLPAVEAALEAERDKVKILRAAARRVIDATNRAKKVYGGTLSFDAVCELDRLEKALATTEDE